MAARFSARNKKPATWRAAVGHHVRDCAENLRLAATYGNAHQAEAGEQHCTVAISVLMQSFVAYCSG